MIRLRFGLSHVFLVGLVLFLLFGCQSVEQASSGKESTVGTTSSTIPLQKPTPSPRPTSSPTATTSIKAINGRLVFESRRQDTNGDGVVNPHDGIHLYRLDLASKALTQLTRDNHFDIEPAWSPDGTQIAFASNRGGNYDIFVINVVENGIHHSQSSIQLLEIGTGFLMELELGRHRVDEPRWLPRDGSFISIVHTPGEFASTSISIYEVKWENDQPHLTQIHSIDDGVGPYVWGPEGRWLIMPFSNKPQDSTREAFLTSSDLIWLSVNYRESWTESPYSLYGKSVLITDNTFYDYYPDWTP